MDSLAVVYAEEMTLLIDDAVYKLCSGCMVNHPSQHQHDVCLMMDKYQQLNYVFDELISMIDESRIQSILHSKWDNALHLDPVKLILLQKKCHCALWQSASWKTTVFDLMKTNAII